MFIPDYLKDTVVFLYAGKGARRSPIGTAFFVHVTESDMTFVYLVTCKHVIKPPLDRGETIYVRMNRSDKMDVAFVELAADVWLFHIEDHVDLAMMRWIPKERPVIFAVLDFNDVLASNHRKYGVAEGEEVLFVGLFADFMGSQRNVPAVRFGHVALVTTEPLEGEYGPAPQFLVECQAYPGNSGAPLFVSTLFNDSLTLFLAGIITSFYPEVQKMRNTKGELRIYTHFGISAVTHADRLKEMIHGYTEMNAREEVKKAERKKKKPEPASLDAGESSFSRKDFEDSLRRVSRRSKPSPPEQASSGT